MYAVEEALAGRLRARPLVAEPQVVDHGRAEGPRVAGPHKPLAALVQPPLAGERPRAQPVGISKAVTAKKVDVIREAVIAANRELVVGVAQAAAVGVILHRIAGAAVARSRHVRNPGKL